MSRIRKRLDGHKGQQEKASFTTISLSSIQTSKKRVAHLKEALRGNLSRLRMTTFIIGIVERGKGEHNKTQ